MSLQRSTPPGVQGEVSDRSRALAHRAHELIPGGCHTYSKGDDQFPDNAPRFIVRATGCYAYDTDGNEFLDWGMGLRSVILGHCYPRVLKAVADQLALGANFTLPSPIEVELAETLVHLIPSAEMVKFAKDGSDVTSAAVRLARAFTGRDHVARCREHPFFSFYDWFIGSTASPAGVPSSVRQLTLQFSYNDLQSLESLFAAYPNQIAAVILEPVTTEPPAPGFLQTVKEIAVRNGALLIFDEMITGFRWHLRGAQTYFGVTPDLSTFGKAIGNGFSVSVLAGRRDVMELGGIRHGGQRVFLLSATHGGETHALAATLATVSELQARDVISHIWQIGTMLQEGVNGAAREAGLDGVVSAEGYPCSPVIVCRDHLGHVSPEFRTLLLQEMIAQGVLIPYVAPSFSHTAREVERTVEAIRQSFRSYERALAAGSVEGLLRGAVVQPVFRPRA